MSTYIEMRKEFGDDIPWNKIQAYDEARADWSESVVEAADELAARWEDGMLASDVGPKFTCDEIAPLLTLLRALGRDHAAEAWEQGHGEGDDDEFDEHHDIYKSITNEEN